MYKSLATDIKQYKLTDGLLPLHKVEGQSSDFGMDTTDELLEGGYGLYSSVNMVKSIGPIKSEYYRIGLVRAGEVDITIGLETFRAGRDHIVLGFPGQIFSLQDPTPDCFVYYMLFSEGFIPEMLGQAAWRAQFPFLTYAGVQCFPLSAEDAMEAEEIILKMNVEVKGKKQQAGLAIRMYIQLLWILANRSYSLRMLSGQASSSRAGSLFTRFIRLVSEHHLTVRKVAEYADMLHVSADHLNRTIRAQSDKTAGELIDEMILREAKTSLMHTSLSVAEISYKLGFSDPSHFSRFFSKATGTTPLRYRGRS